MEGLTRVICLLEEVEDSSQLSRAMCIAGVCGAPFQATPEPFAFRSTCASRKARKRHAVMSATASLAILSGLVERVQHMSQLAQACASQSTRKFPAAPPCRSLILEVLCRTSHLLMAHHPAVLHALITNGILDFVANLHQTASALLANSAPSAVRCAERDPAAAVKGLGGKDTAASFPLPFAAIRTSAWRLERSLLVQVAQYASQLPENSLEATCVFLLDSLKSGVGRGKTTQDWSQAVKTLRLLKSAVLEKQIRARCRTDDWINALCDTVSCGHVYGSTVGLLVLEHILIPLENKCGEAGKDAVEDLSMTSKRKLANFLFAQVAESQCDATRRVVTQLLRKLTVRNRDWAAVVLGHVADVLGGLSDTLWPPSEGPAASKMLAALHVIGEKNTGFEVGACLRHPVHGHGVVVDAMHQAIVSQQPKEIRCPIGPEKAGHSYYGIFFDVTSGELPIRIDAVIAVRTPWLCSPVAAYVSIFCLR